MARGDPAVAAEELRGLRQLPQPFEIERPVGDELLQEAVHLLVRPLERDRLRVDRVRERVQDRGRLVHAVRLADEQKPRLLDRLASLRERLTVEGDAAEAVAPNGGAELGRRRDDQRTT